MTSVNQEPRPCPKCGTMTQVLAPSRGYHREFCHKCQDILGSWPTAAHVQAKADRSAARKSRTK